jgi:4-amino-4-deoxy-L-arabinose transferase-like glycosyltransferase
LRVAALLELSALPTFHVLIVDAERYDRLARELVAAGGLPARPFDQAPLYPYFLAAVYGLGGSPFAARLLQVVLDAGTVVLVAAAADRLWRPPHGAVAGLLAAFYGPLVFQSTLLLKETLGIAACALLLYLLAAPAPRGPRPAALAAAGLALGLACLVRENLLLLVPVVAGWVALAAPVPDRRRRLAALAAGLLVALAPVALLNRRAGGEWFLTSSQAGMNLWIGNHRGAPGTNAPLAYGTQRPEAERADARRIAAALLTTRSGRRVAPESLSPGEVSRLLWREGQREIAADPAAWLGLMARKLRLFWNAYEIPDSEGFELYRSRSRSLRLAGVGFGWIAPLAAVGLVCAWRRQPRAAALLALLAAAVCASVVLFFVFGRYRLPVVVPLLPLAAAGVVETAARVNAARRQPRAAAVALGILAATALAVGAPAFPPADRREHLAVQHHNVGSAGLSWTDPPLAAALAAAEPEARRTAMAVAAARLQPAVADLERAVVLRPEFVAARLAHAAALHRRGILAALAGRPAEAGVAYDAALAEIERARLLPGWSAGMMADAEALAAAIDANRGRLGGAAPSAVRPGATPGPPAAPPPPPR